MEWSTQRTHTFLKELRSSRSGDSSEDNAVEYTDLEPHIFLKEFRSSSSEDNAVEYTDLELPHLPEGA